METEIERRKSQHAEYLFNEMSKFKKHQLLCNITIPGKLELASVHKVFGRSEQSSVDETVITSSSKCEQLEIPQFEPLLDDEVFIIEDNEDNDSNGDTPLSKSVEKQLNALNELRRQHRHCDVTLEVDECTCFAHKMVLAACSEYFRAMFTLKMKEYKMSHIPLKEVDGRYFKIILDFIYSGELSLKNWEDCLELLKMAVFFQIPSLIELCCNNLLSDMDIELACILSRASRDLALVQLLEKSVQYIHDNFLLLDYPSSPVDLLAADDLVKVMESNFLGKMCSVRSELSILRIVLRWLIANPQSPSKNDVVSLVRFALISPAVIMNACKEILEEFNADVISGSKASFCPVFRKHLLNALLYHNSLYKQPLSKDRSTMLRCLNQTWVTIDGVMTPSTVTLIDDSKFVFNEKNFDDAEPIRDPFHSVVVINNFIYVIGGTRVLDEGYSSKVHRYDPRIDEWISVADMLEERGDFVAVAYEKYIYVFGGRNRRGALRTCERYDVSNNQWEYVALLPENLYMAAGLAAKGKIYITGGFNDYETVGTTFCYDPLSNDWKQIFSPMISERGYHVITTGPDGRLWVIGGVDNPFSGRNVWEVEAFDLDNQTWMYVGQIIPVKLLLSAIRLNCFHTNDGHICISAVTQPKKYSTLEYDPESKMWLEIKKQVSCVQLNMTS